MAQGVAAAAAGAQAMIDLSDGLVADLRHVADASGVGIDLSTAALAADHDALTAAAAVVDADPGRGCWPAAKTMPWRRVSPVRRRPGGASSVGCSTGLARVLVDGAGWSGYAGWESFAR